MQKDERRFHSGRVENVSHVSEDLSSRRSGKATTWLRVNRDIDLKLEVRPHLRSSLKTPEKSYSSSMMITL
jgi:hypothetical protein